MALDKLVDSTQLDGALTATANAIRSKTGSSDTIAWDATNGFKNAIEAIGDSAVAVIKKRILLLLTSQTIQLRRHIWNRDILRTMPRELQSQVRLSKAVQQKMM